MKLMCLRIVAVAFVIAGLFTTARAATVNATFDTNRYYLPANNTGNRNVYIHDEMGAYITTMELPAEGIDDGFGNAAYTRLYLSTSMAPGRYSFGIQADDLNYFWTGINVVASGDNFPSFGNEAFWSTSAPVVAPAVTVPGSLLVEGSIEMQGQYFNMGTNPMNDDEPAFTLKIENGGSQLTSLSATESASWTWRSPFSNGMYLTSGPGSAHLYVNTSLVLTQANFGTAYIPSKLTIGSGSAVGANSFTSGNGVTASGTYSGAFGLGTIAQGYNQFVVGQYNTLQGTSSANTNAADSLFIIGNGSGTGARSNALSVSRSGDMKVSGRLSAGQSALASGTQATALGWFAAASGDYSLALGPNATALNSTAIAMGPATALGQGAFATGNESVAAGDWSFANGGSYAGGHNSLAMGSYSSTEGLASVAIGQGVIARGVTQMVIGQYNVPSGTPHNDWETEWDAWEPNEAAFIIGNGQTSTNRSNAFTVERNGNVNAAGKIRVWPTGDLSMGTFKTGTKPTVGVDPDGP